MLKLRSAALLVALAGVLGAAAPAWAQYREGVPTVIPQPPPRDPDAAANAVLGQFAAWNRAAGRPRILVFWNRAYTDETATREIGRVVETEDTRNGHSTVTDTTNTRFGQTSQTNEDDIGHRNLERVTSSEVVTGGLHAAMDPRVSRAQEATFANMFMQTGAQLIDRDALVRRVSANMAPGDRADLQFVESKALSEGIVYLIEVLPDPDPNAPTGMVFSVSIRHLPTSTLVAQFMTAGAPPPGPSHFVATSHGFERTTENRATTERIAAQVAVEAMERFVQQNAH